MAESNKNLTVKVVFWVSVVLIALMAGVIGIFWKILPPQLPWLYSFPWGETQLIDKWWLLAILLGMEVVVFVTRLIAGWSGKDDETVQNTIMIGVWGAVALMTASFFRIMMIFLRA